MVLGLLGVLVVCVFNPWTLKHLTELYWRVENSPGRDRLLIIDSLLLLLSIPFVMAPFIVRLLRSLAVRLPRVTATLFGTFAGLLLIALLFLAAEGVTRVFPPDRAWPEDGYHVTGAEDHDIYHYNRWLSYAPEPGLQFSVRRVIKGREVYDVTYDIDECGRRATSMPAEAAPSKFALFFGGSFTYGDGVDGHETLPAHFGTEGTDYRPYNYAFSGYGPQHMLARLENLDIRAEVKEESGIGIYVFMDDHISRAIGASHVIRDRPGSYPFYAERDGELIHGVFSEHYPIRSLAYRCFNWSRLLQRLQVSFPIRLRESHYRLAARIILESRNRFVEQFGDLPFIVLISPGCRRAKPLIRILEEEGLPVFDYTNLVDVSEDRYHIWNDWHPTGACNAVIGAELAKNITEIIPIPEEPQQ